MSMNRRGYFVLARTEKTVICSPERHPKGITVKHQRQVTIGRVDDRQALSQGRRMPSAQPPVEEARAPRTQADATREKLIAAARAQFLADGYFAVSVDDIAKAAGLSRATFYLHFQSKEQVLVALVCEESMGLDSFYRWFARNRPTKANIRRFVLLLVRINKLSRRQMSLFRQASAYSNDVIRMFSVDLERHLGMMGESIPAFLAGGRAASQERRRHAQARLLYYQLEQFAFFASALGDEIDLDAETDALVDNIRAFIKEFGQR